MRKGFTLVEVLIAISIFTLASVIASNILVDVFKLEQKTEVENAVFEDIRLMMQTLTNEIQNGTIDYEEYYSMYVVQAADPKYYGLNYGVYASSFYDPGKSSRGDATNPKDLGVECSVRAESGECEIYFTSSVDENIGRNANAGDNSINAFCEFNRGLCDNFAGENVDNVSVEVDELYLIDKTGTNKTILGSKLIKAGHRVLGLMRMEGKDYDQNGVIDIFSCLPEFKCVDVPDGKIHYPGLEDLQIKVPEKNDLNTPFDINQTQFVPISPLRTHIKDLKFIITPVENPFNAFAEDNAQIHPTVTIIMTVVPAPDIDYPGEFEEIVVQTTVAAGVKDVIKSYPPVRDRERDIFDNAVDSWISDVDSWISDVVPRR